MAPKAKARKPAEPKQTKASSNVSKKADKPAAKAVKATEAKPPALSRKRKADAELDEMASVAHFSHGQVAGDVFVIGDGDCGQFGLGEDVVEAPRPLPTSADGQQALQVAAGGMHSLLLAADHTVFSTGVNDEGALGRHTASDVWKATDGEPGDAYTWGRVEVPTAHGHVIQLTAGDSHSTALTSHGAVYAWGTYRDATGVFGFAPGKRIGLLPTLIWEPKRAADQAVKLASGTDHTVLLTRGGEMYTWGTGGQGQLGRVGARMTERHMHEVLLAPHPVKRTKRRRGMSVNSAIVDVACGSYATYAVDEQGHTWGWGLNNYGQLGIQGQEPAYTPQIVDTLQEVKVQQLRGGQHHCLALTQDNQLHAFGRPTYGRLGRDDVGASSDDAVPETKPVSNLEGVSVAGMAAGIMVSGCYSKDGQAYLWGANTNSQLGKGDDDEDELVPLKLKETKRFRDRKVIGMEIGGQMAFLLAVAKDTAEAQPAAATTNGTAKGAANGAAKAAAKGVPKGAPKGAVDKTASAAASVEASKSAAESEQTGQDASADGPPEPVPMDAESS